MSRGWLLELRLDDIEYDVAKYSVYAAGWAENGDLLVPPLVGKVRVFKTDLKYSFTQAGAWKNENFLPEVILGSCQEVDPNKLWDSLVKDKYNWWFHCMRQCLIEVCKESEFPPRVSRYQ